MKSSELQDMMTACFEHPWWEEFERYDAEHPEVFEWMVRLVRSCQAKGMTKIGMRYVAERFRWEAEIDIGEDLKLNANLVPLYARVIAYEHPELAGMFEFRSLGS